VTGAEVGVAGAGGAGVGGVGVGCLVGFFDGAEVGATGAGGAGVGGVGVIEHSAHPLQPSQVHANSQVFFLFAERLQ